MQQAASDKQLAGRTGFTWSQFNKPLHCCFMCKRSFIIVNYTKQQDLRAACSSLPRQAYGAVERHHVLIRYLVFTLLYSSIIIANIKTGYIISYLKSSWLKFMTSHINQFYGFLMLMFSLILTFYMLILQTKG